MSVSKILNISSVEAVRRFRARKYAIRFSRQDAALHARALTVARAMNLDVHPDIRRAVDRAISEGTTFATFREDIEPLLTRRGWWGR